MFGIGVPELILILVVGLIVFGPGKLPEMGRSLGKGIREFRKASNALTAAINAPEPPPAQPAAAPAAQPAAQSAQAVQATTGHPPQHRHPPQCRPQLLRRLLSRRTRWSRRMLPQKSRHNRNV